MNKWQSLDRQLQDIFKISLELEDSIRLVLLLVSELGSERTYMKIGNTEDQEAFSLNRNEEL